MLFLVLLSVTVLTVDSRGGGDGAVDSLREGAQDILSPVRTAGDAVFDPVGDAFRGVTGYDELEDENVRLRARLEEVEGERVRGEAAVDSLRDLRTILRIDDFTALPRVPARVVSVPVSNYEQTIELDRGTSAGVREGMPVVTGSGLVGRVVQASNRRSTVQLISDLPSSVGVVLTGSGETGVAGGRGPGEPLLLDYISAGARIEPGEVVETSGVNDSLFPPGLPIGRVGSVENPPGGIEQSVDVEPLADLERLDLVAVLQWETVR